MEQDYLSPADMRFGAKLDRLIVRRNTTASAVAERASVSDATVGRWINKGAMPRLDEAAATAEFLGVSLDSMVDDAIEEPLPRAKAGDAPAIAAVAPVILSDDERTILNVYRDCNLDRRAVVEALTLLKAHSLAAAGELTTSTGDVLIGGPRAAKDARNQAPERRQR